MLRLALDHLAVAAATVAAGAAAIEAALGQAPGPGGRHAAMGTENRLLGLGDLYLEAIAPDPEAPAPPRPRWFGLDAPPAAPRLAVWVLRCDDLAAVERAFPEVGEPVALARGPYAWRITVPADGGLPWGGAMPAFIAWEQGGHPAAALPDRGLRLLRLEVGHPEAAALAGRLRPHLEDPRIGFVAGPVGLRALVATPAGPRWLA